MIEEWRNIKGCKGLYQVSNLGRLYSKPRKNTKGGYSYGFVDCDGYLLFNLSVDGVRIKKQMHKLVYETFNGEIPEGYDVHHINHNRKDNRLENLEIIEKKEHSKLHINDRRIGVEEKRTKTVIQLTIGGEFVAEYISTMDAERITKVSHQRIGGCCLGKRKTAGGFKWKYKEVA